jgi:M6 family metalloprotease-like protein
MKKLKIFLMFVLLFLICINLISMPPHPDLLNEKIKKNEINKLSKQLSAMKNRGMNKASMLKSFPTSGNRRVLVILVQYNGGISLKGSKRTFQYASFGFLSISMLFTVIFGFFKKKKGTGLFLSTFLVVLIIPFSLILITSCPIVNGGSGGGGSGGGSSDNNTSSFNGVFNSGSTTNFYSELFNGGGSTTLTWRKYYQDMSANAGASQLNLQFDIVGPYTASNSATYYGQNIGGLDAHPATLAGEAIDLAEANGVDFSIYDNDSDGSVDAVVIIHAGRGEESGAHPDTIWSHRWDLASGLTYGDGSGPRTYDGRIINDYTMQPEYVFSPGDSTIGVFCHEFGHVLGLPDLYDTTYASNGVGSWSIMAFGSWNGPGNDGSVPAPLLAWEKEYIDTNWVTITDAAAGFNTITDIETTNHQAYKVPLGPTTQYLLIERKAQTGGYWDQYLPADGLLITHIDEFIITNTIAYNKVNSNTTNIPSNDIHGINIKEADNDNYLWDKSGTQTTDTYLNGDSLIDPRYNTYTGVSFTNGVISGTIGSTATSREIDQIELNNNRFSYTP